MKNLLNQEIKKKNTELKWTEKKIEKKKTPTEKHILTFLVLKNIIFCSNSLSEYLAMPPYTVVYNTSK